MNVDIDDDLNELWAQYAETNVSRVEALQSATLALLQGTADPEGLRESERAAHKLAGSLGTFGFSRASALAAEAEGIFERGASRPDARRLSEIVLDLRMELLKARPQGSQTAHAEPKHEWSVLLIDSDPAEAERLRLAILRHGIAVTVERSIEAGPHRVDLERPDAALLSVPGSARLSSYLERFTSGASVSTQFFVLADAATLANRVAAAEAGVRCFFERSTRAEEVAAAIALQARNARRRRTVLAIDDDVAILDVVARSLEAAGFAVRKLTEPTRFLEVLSEVVPDLILMDLDMPGVDGLALCRTARTHPRWETVPIVFLSGKREPAVIARMFAAGADDYVSKPIDPNELVSRVNNRTRRLEMVSGGEARDAAGRAAQQARAGHEIAASVRRVNERGGPASAVVFGIAGSGDSAADGQVMSSSLESELPADTCICRWNETRFMVVLEKIGVEDSGHLAERIVGRMQQAKIRCVAAMVPLPSDISDGHDLFRATESLIEEALRSGRAVVVATGEALGGTQTIDVAVVEDEPMLAGLLTHALQRRGIRTTWFSDGTAALRSLVGDPPLVRTRIVLLDVDLPSIDGLSVLTRLAEAGLTRRTRVIMLTVRSAEGEVLRALQLGAFDHVAKPFSLPILLRKIEIAMET